MKKTIFLITLAFLPLTAAGPVDAALNRQMLRDSIEPEITKAAATRQNAIELKKSLSPTIAAVKEQLQERNKGIIDTLKERIKAAVNRRFHGTIKGISGSVITVSTDKGDANVAVTESTVLKRKFGADSALSEFAVNDELAIVGKQKNAGTDSEIEARYIRNLSIQRRNTVFNGTVTSLNAGDSSFVVKTAGRGDQTAYAGKDTVITDKNTPIEFADLKTGDRVIVKGELWDRANTKIDAKRIIRLPAKPSPSATTAP
jgi:hypothetical protein